MSSPEDSQGTSGACGAQPTCLHAEHVRAGAYLVDFHGWLMPLRYTTIPEEHLKVRHCAGLFDLCHMGRIEIVGPDAAAWVGKVITNDYDTMRPGAARYSLICNERGGILDDAIVYKLPQSALLVVNASNRTKVIAWMEDARGSLDAKLIDRTRDMAMVAIQGPQAVRILPGAVERFDGDWAGMKYYSITTAHILGKVARIARTGYTGEDGFEVYLEAADAPALWRRLLEIGGNRVAPVGLGARDTLRLEAAMPLYGNELDEETDPFEAGLEFAVKLDKAVPFLGRERLVERKEKGPSRTLVGFRMLGRRVARQGMAVRVGDVGAGAAPATEDDASAGAATGNETAPRGAPEGTSPGVSSPGAPLVTDLGERRRGAAGGAGEASRPGEPVGRITSGAPSPTLGCPIALGYLSTSIGERERAALWVDVRGNREPTRIEPLPFFSRTRRKAKD